MSIAIWANTCNMSLKQFELQLKYLYIVDNNTYKRCNDYKLFKIRPLMEAARNNCVMVPKEKYVTIDKNDNTI